MKLLDYKIGGHYTLYFEHPKGNFIIQGSAGWKEGTLDSLQSDIIFMGIAGLGVQTEEYREKYFEQLLDLTKAKDVYLIHWDGFIAPIDGALNTECLLLEWYMPSHPELTFNYVLDAIDARDNVRPNLLPKWGKVVLLE